MIAAVLLHVDCRITIILFSAILWEPLVLSEDSSEEGMLTSLSCHLFIATVGCVDWMEHSINAKNFDLVHLYMYVKLWYLMYHIGGSEVVRTITSGYGHH